jgi:hypothetical protein
MLADAVVWGVVIPTAVIVLAGLGIRQAIHSYNERNR